MSEAGSGAGRGRYRVVYEYDDSHAWTVEVPDVPGCHTWGETLRQARAHAREALSLWVDDAEDAELVEELRLPERTGRAVDESRDARARADREQQQATQRTRQAAEVLVSELGLTLRDAGEVLGLSFQRVQQLLGPAGPARGGRGGRGGRGQARAHAGRAGLAPPDDGSAAPGEPDDDAAPGMPRAALRTG